MKHIEKSFIHKILCFLSELKQEPKIHFPETYQNHANSLKIELFFVSLLTFWHENSNYFP